MSAESLSQDPVVSREQSQEVKTRREDRCCSLGGMGDREQVQAACSWAGNHPLQGVRRGSRSLVFPCRPSLSLPECSPPLLWQIPSAVTKGPVQSREVLHPLMCLTLELKFYLPGHYFKGGWGGVSKSQI